MAETVPGLVSTIIPVHNRPELLQAAVNSVLAQTYRAFEIIIVDDGSTDDTAAVADKLSLAYPELIRVIHQQNAGPGLSREAGRQIAQGEFIQYLDSDDLLMPNKFAWQVAGLKASPDCGVAYGKTRHYRAGEPAPDVPWKRTGEHISMMFPAFLKSRWWGTSTPLYRRTLTDAAGPWLNLWNEEDWEYDCRIAAMGVKLYYCDEFVSDQHVHEGDRLSIGGTILPEKLQNRAEAHRHILHHAWAAHIPADSDEMRHFARELFLLSRQCGAAGLVEASQMLFELALQASTEERRNGLDFRLYALTAKIIGWRYAGSLSHCLDWGRGILKGMWAKGTTSVADA